MIKDSPGSGVAIQGMKKDTVLKVKPEDVERAVPSDHRMPSLLSCIFFCPIGLFSLIFSMQVRKSIKAGDLSRARRLSSLTIALAVIAGTVFIVGSLTLASVYTNAIYKDNCLGDQECIDNHWMYKNETSQ